MFSDLNPAGHILDKQHAHAQSAKLAELHLHVAFGRPNPSPARLSVLGLPGDGTEEESRASRGGARRIETRQRTIAASDDIDAKGPGGARSRSVNTRISPRAFRQISAAKSQSALPKGSPPFEKLHCHGQATSYPPPIP